jgi:UDP-N-acetylglucosamine 4-epimerase
MARISEVEELLRSRPRNWLVTGGAGFIGSHLVGRLLQLGQRVVVLDNFATGHRHNLEEVRPLAQDTGGELTVIEGDIRSLETCKAATAGVTYVLHQAALGSVPRSLKDPLSTHQVNVDGTVNMLLAARDAGVERFVYASSSSVYGDHPALPKQEDGVGRPLSPYAVSKKVDEYYARIFADSYGLETIGLRYFNVFGRRQDPEGPYAAVIPRWVAALLRHQTCTIFGDGETSRDFCFVGNVVQANLLAAAAPANSEAVNKVYNVACGARTTLTGLYAMIRDQLAKDDPAIASLAAQYEGFRPGDIRHSHADTSRARALLGYDPDYSVGRGLEETMPWYVAQAKNQSR